MMSDQGLKDSIQQLNLIVPCYNPSDGWHNQLLERYQELERELSSWKMRLMLVNDGSTRGVDPSCIDHLRSSIEDFTYLSYDENQGKGFAIKHGLSQVTDGVIGFTDVDFPYETSCFLEMIQAIHHGADLIIGHRSSSYYEAIPWSRKVLSRGLKHIIRLLMRLPVTDTQSGLKLFTPEVSTIMASCTVNRYLFDLELVKRTHQAGLEVKSIPLTLRPNIEMPGMPPRIILQEMLTFIRLILS